MSKPIVTCTCDPGASEPDPGCPVCAFPTKPAAKREEVMSEELKPCPLCKGPARRYQSEAGGRPAAFCAAEMCPMNKDPLDADAWQLLPRPDALHEPREALAEYAHEVWSRWAQTLLDEGITDERRTRWKQLIDTPYAELSEEMKNYDRAEADRMLAIVGPDAPGEVWLIRQEQSHGVSHVAATEADAKWLADPDEVLERWPVERRDGTPAADCPTVQGEPATEQEELAARETLAEIDMESAARGPKVVRMDCPRCGSGLIKSRSDAFECLDCCAYIGGPDGLAVRPFPVHSVPTAKCPTLQGEPLAPPKMTFTETAEREKVGVRVVPEKSSLGYRVEDVYKDAPAKECGENVSTIGAQAQKIIDLQSECERLREVMRKELATQYSPECEITVREACRKRMTIRGADAQALERALTITERERDASKAECARLRGELSREKAALIKEARERCELEKKVSDHNHYHHRDCVDKATANAESRRADAAEADFNRCLEREKAQQHCRKEADDLRAALKRTLVREEALNGELEKARNENERMVPRYNEIHEKLCAEIDENDRLRRELEAEREMGDVAADLRAGLNHYLAREKELEEKLERARSDYSGLVGLHNQRGERIVNLEAELEKARKDLTYWDGMAQSNMAQRKKDEEVALRERDSRIVTLETDLQDQTQRNGDLEDDLAKARGELATKAQKHVVDSGGGAFHDGWNAAHEDYERTHREYRKSIVTLKKGNERLIEENEDMIRIGKAWGGFMHLDYGCCDGMGREGMCSECLRIIATLEEENERLKKGPAHFDVEQFYTDSQSDDSCTCGHPPGEVCEEHSAKITEDVMGRFVNEESEALEMAEIRMSANVMSAGLHEVRQNRESIRDIINHLRERGQG